MSSIARSIAAVSFCLALLACGSGPSTDGTAPEPPDDTDGDELGPGDEPASDERPMMTVEECEAQGIVVGDIGDGAVHRPDYRCPNGEPPIGTVPSGIEGAVCCPGGDAGGDGEPAASECAEGGWPRPTGEPPEGCHAVHAGCCYPSAAAACAAAGCEPDTCRVMESYPAQVACE